MSEWVRVSNCKCICRQKNSLCSSNAKYGELVRVSSVKCEVSGSDPLANHGDRIRAPYKSGRSENYFFA